MATSQLSRVIHTLRRAALPCWEAGLTDGQLLETYVGSRAEAAFAALVRRHGPMVWGVCRRVLRSHHDAEDAFQATFLVLVRKAASIVHREKVANWLYGVAHQTALKARAEAAKRQARQKQVTYMPEPAAQPQDSWNELQPVLAQELGRLPDKYRAVIILCDLEGKTRKEAAREFHLPEGTVATRLATARTMLAKRLAWHGLTLSGVALAGVLSQNVASAGMPAAVASSAIKAANLFAAGQATAQGVLSIKAVALTEGVLKTMLLTKLKTAMAVLGVVFATAGVLWTGLWAFGNPGLADPSAAEQATNPAVKNRPVTINGVRAEMLRQVGNRFDVAIVGRTDGLVSGTDVYFYDSSIETAAVHAGLVKRGAKAVVTVTVIQCPPHGIGSTRNGVTSLPWDGAKPPDTAFRLDLRGKERAQGKNQAEKPASHGKEPEKLQTDHDRIQGTWVFVSCMVGGKKVWNEAAPPKSLTITGDKARFLLTNGDGQEVENHSSFKLNPDRKPKEIDLTNLDGLHKGKITLGIYELEGDTLQLCHPEPVQAKRPRPRTLESKEGSTDYVWTLKRVAKQERGGRQTSR